MKTNKMIVILAITVLLTGCTSTGIKDKETSSSHIEVSTVAESSEKNNNMETEEKTEGELVEEQAEDKKEQITIEAIKKLLKEENEFVTTFNVYLNKEDADYITYHESSFSEVDGAFGSIEAFYAQVDALYSQHIKEQLIRSLGIIEENGKHYALSMGFNNFLSDPENIKLEEITIPGYNKAVVVEEMYYDTVYKRVKDFVVEGDQLKLNTLPSGDKFETTDKISLINRENKGLFVSKSEPILISYTSNQVDKIQKVLTENYKNYCESLKDYELSDEEDEMYVSCWAAYNMDAQLGDTLSIADWNSVYSHGAAHGMPSCRPFNFIISTGEMYQLADVFKTDYDYKSVINNEVRQHFEDNEFYGADYFDTIDEGTYFYFSKRGLTVYFDIYEYGPYAAGTQPVLVEFSKLLVGINDVFKERFMIVGTEHHLMTINESEQIWIDHAFEVNLTSGYGEDFVYPKSNEEGNLMIEIDTDDKTDIIYSSAGEHGYEFFDFLGIGFPDLNEDGLKDIVFIAEYITGISDTGGQPFKYPTVLFNSQDGFHQDENLKDKLIYSGVETVPEIIKMVKETL